MARQVGGKDISQRERLEIVAFLRARLRSDGTLPKGTKTLVATQYSCHRNTIQRVWNARDLEPAPVRPGPTPRFTTEEIVTLIESVPLSERTSIRATAAAARLPKSTLQDYVGKGKPLRRRTGRVKPALTDAHKTERLQFALSHVETTQGKIKCMQYCIHFRR
jgi:hypothetical protein